MCKRSDDIFFSIHHIRRLALSPYHSAHYMAEQRDKEQQQPPPEASKMPPANISMSISDTGLGELAEK